MIEKFKKGGETSPFVIYEGVAESKLAEKTDKSTGDEGDNNSKGIDDSDLLKLLDNLEGLPSDILAISKEIQKYYYTSNLFGGEQINATNLANHYLNSLSKIKIANFNKKEYDEAKKQVIEKGGLSEVAITEQGLLAAISKDGITQISVEEFRKNPEDYELLSNAKLLNYRAEHLPFDNSLLKVVANGIGMEEVGKIIKASIANLGSSEVSQAGYSKIDQRKIAAGIDFLKHAVSNGYDITSLGVDGLYKINTLNKNQAQQAQQALMYAWSMLPLNAKTLLKFKAGSDKDALNLVGSLITSGLSDVTEFDTTVYLPKEDNTSGKKGGSSGDNEDLPKTTKVERWLMGMGEPTDIIINGGTKYAIHTSGNNVGLVNSEENPLGFDTLEAAHKGNFADVLDWQNVTLGGNQIPTSGLNKVFVTDAAIYRLRFPIDKRALAYGDIKPDLRLSEKVEKAEAEIRKRGIQEGDIENINKIYAKHDLSILFNADGSLTGDYRLFAAINVNAIDKCFNNRKNVVTDFLDIVDDKQARENVMDSYYEATGNDPDDLSIKRKNKIYEGVVFIPVRNNVFNAKGMMEIEVNPTNQLQRKQVASDMSSEINKYFKPMSFNDGE